MKIESELVQKLKDKAFQTENDKLLVKSFEIEREKQLTAVEWLEEQINPYAVSVHQDLFDQAKEMEKEQIVNAWDSAYGGDSYYSGENYYNGTFKQQEQ